MRTVYAMCYFVGYMLISGFLVIPYKLYGLTGRKEKQKKYLHKITTRWARRTIQSTGSKVEVIGLENIPSSNVLLVGNHQSLLDIPLLLGYLPMPKGFIAKVEMLKAPIVRGWMKAIGCLFLDRDNLRQSMNVILKGIEKLKAGETLVIFPEGTRTKTGEVGEFKKGSLQLAVKSGVMVVPLTIDGTRYVYEEKKRVRPTTIRLTIHPPIDPNTLSDQEKKNLAEIVREQIVLGLNK